MEEVQVRLQEASRLFTNKNYNECESVLRGIPNKDMKIQHNLAIVHYLAKGGDVREVIADLKQGSGESIVSATNGSVSLAYEGHEIAHYNRAVLLANQGRCEEAASTLRELLQLHECIAPSVLGRCVCLFQHVTNATAIAASKAPAAGKSKSSVAQTRSKSDEELVGKVLQQYMNEFKKDPQLFRMLQGSLAADASALHELFKTAATPMDKAVYFNDLGVLTMGEGKHQTAALYFAKACRLVADLPNADTHTKHSILFNVGVCSLHRQDYAAALDALLTIQETMVSSAPYWLRLSQAALGQFSWTKTLVDSPDVPLSVTYDAVQQERGALLSRGAVQTGFQLLQLPDAGAPYTSLESLQSPAGVASSAVEALDQRRAVLNLARRAAQNCIQLIGNGQNLSTVADQLNSELRSQDYRTLQYAYLYAASAALLMQDYSVTIRYISDLLAVHRSRPILADVHSSALLHIVEAYCRVNKPAFALRTLSGASLGELLVSTDRTDHQQKLRTEALFVNLVLAHLGCGNVKQAQSIMSTLIPKLTSGASASSASGRAAALLQVYVDLALGNKEKVVEQLSKCACAIASMPI